MCMCPALQALTSVQRLQVTALLQALTHAFPRCPSGPTQLAQWPCAYKPFSVPGCQHLAHHADQQENVQMAVGAQGRQGYRQHRLDWEAVVPAEPQETAFKSSKLALGLWEWQHLCHNNPCDRGLSCAALRTLDSEAPISAAPETWFRGRGLSEKLLI